MSAENQVNRARINELLIKGVKISAVMLAGLGISGCGGEVGIRDKDRAEDYAMAMYKKTYDSASPTGKFMLQYLRSTRIDVQDKDGSDGDNEFHRFTVNNGCLQTSAYNISGGVIRASVQATGFLNSSSASVEAELPAASAFAHVDSDTPDIMTVKSGHSKSMDLHFMNVAGPGPLEPADKQTIDITEGTYGCERGFNVGYEHISGYTSRATSPYILHIPIPRDEQ